MSEPSTPGLEPAFDVRVDLGPPDDLGLTRVGHRRIVPIVGGAISGGLEAEIVPGGADWQVLRDDGAIEIDCRYGARTPDGEHLYLQVHGVRSGSPEVLAALLDGAPVDPDRYYFRTAIRIEASSARLAHLQRSVYVASCIREAATVRFRAYRLT